MDKHYTPRQQNIVVICHKYTSGPDDDLVRYLNDRLFLNVLHIRHSFSSLKDRRSYCTWYREGKVFKEYKTADYRILPEPLLYLKELIFSVWWILRSGLVVDKYIGLDGLCALFGQLLKTVSGRIKQSIFWAIDFVPTRRFEGDLKNWVYSWINWMGYKNSDQMWDLGPKMAQAREDFLGIKVTDYRLHRVVPYGAWLDHMPKYTYDECEKNTLVYMGHIHEKSGIQLVIEAIPEIVNRVPDFKFKIIGGGGYVDNLIDLARVLNVSSYCNFLGKIDDIRVVETEIAKSALAIAPYVSALDTFTRYADPGKVKTYLACGVPVLLTKVPWNANEIQDNECGKIIAENKNDIASSVVELLTSPSMNQQYRVNALKYSMRFDYKNIFSFIAS